MRFYVEYPRIPRLSIMFYGLCRAGLAGVLAPRYGIGDCSSWGIRKLCRCRACWFRELELTIYFWLVEEYFF